MRVLVNTLSIGSLSGQHVVYGFLTKLVEWTRLDHEFVILHDETTPPPDSLLGPNVSCISMPHALRNWSRRAVWEICELPKLIRSQNIEILLNPSGARIPGIPSKQVVLAQNPWCFVRKVHQNWKERLKASLQRRSYRDAYRFSDFMLFISDHLRSLYESAAGNCRPAPHDIAYVGIGDDTYSTAQAALKTVSRDPHLIVSVSAMAPWKGTDTLVNALGQVRQQGIPAKLRLVGPWPNPAYESKIRQLVDKLKLTDCITITGQVSRDDLHRNYAEARLFCLMSHCESFGIPAAEAQVFGTPVVAATGCAIPEVCAEGGLYGPPSDVAWTANTLTKLITDETEWQSRSTAARLNSQKLHWELTTQPFMKMFSL